jgi:4-hydroxy-tetrahydrodipicolinate synthase
MSSPPFTGVGVALVTLFHDDGSLDAEATADLASQLADCGVQAVLVAGTTGEAMTLSVEERVALVGAVRSAVPSAIPVIAGTGAATGAQATELTRAAVDAGADAVLALSPHLVEDPRPYFDTVAKACAGTPLLGYHFPAVSAPGIPVEHLAELPVDGLKDSSGEPERLLQEIAAFTGAVYVGSSAVLTMAGAVGADGAILTMANARPELCAEAFAGDGTAQTRLLTDHLVGTRGLPAGIKALTAARFGTSTAARLGS